MSKYFSNRFKVPHFAGMAYKTDGPAPTKEEKEAKEKREKEIKAAQAAYDEFEIKEPEDVEKKFALQKALYELKGEADLKNYEEKMTALEAIIEEEKTTAAEEKAALVERMGVMEKGFDLLQTRFAKEKKSARDYIGTEIKTFNEYLAETIAENADTIRAFQKGAAEVKMEMKAVGDMSLANNFPGATPFVQQVQNRLIETPYNRVWLADLLPSGTAVGNSIIYPKENGGEGGAAVWTDRTTNKAQMDFDLTSQTAFFKWIAGWVEVDRDMLDDVNFLTSYLQSKMLISLKTAENDFIMNGTSDTNPVDGLLDVATAYNGSFTLPVDRLADAAWGQIPTDTFDFYNPTTAILHPRDAVKIGLNKAGGESQTNGSQEYSLPPGSVAFSAGKLVITGLEVARTTQMTPNNFLVFDKFATLLVRRMQPELRMFEDAVLAKKNRVMFRIEERLTLAIFNNAAIVTGELEESS